VTANYSYVKREIGKLDEFLLQMKINEPLGLTLTAPVYKAWKINNKPSHSPNLKNVSTLSLLYKIIPITHLHNLVTVRQIHYVLVSAQHINNNIQEYRRVVRIVKKARLAGLISFKKVTDDTREAEKTPSWNSPEAIVRAAINQYRSHWWSEQDYYVEVWLEKRSLRRIFYPITNSYGVYLCIGGGYQSWSAIFQANERLYANANKKKVILYFGDLDPSGKDMPRDILSRLSMLGSDVEVIDVALRMEDVSEYSLPRNPAKKTDSRSRWYVDKYGIDYAVELDALPPKILEDKINEAIHYFCDIDLLKEKQYGDIVEKRLWEKWVESISTAR
jgi:hypothetical protein